jgi:hypothetical protein
MRFNYSLKSLGESSRKYGECEVCDKDVSEVHIQTETREFLRPDKTIGNTHLDCSIFLGHKDCLLKLRRLR